MGMEMEMIGLRVGQSIDRRKNGKWVEIMNSQNKFILTVSWASTLNGFNI